MGLSDKQVRAAVERAFATIGSDAERLRKFKDYYSGRQMKPKIPSNVDPNMKSLVERSVTNLMRLAVNIPAQLSFVEGFSRVGKAEGDVDLDPPEWAKWVEAGFRAQQTNVFRTALKYGHSFVMVDPVDGLPRLLSTRDTTAYFADPVNDRVPVFAVTFRRPSFGNGELVYMDDERVVVAPVDDFSYFRQEWFDSGEVLVQEHSLGRCPVVRFPCELDDEGNATGIIEPLIPAQDRVNQSAFDLLVDSSYGAFAVRWAAGLTGEPILNSDGDPVKDENDFIKYKPIEISQQRMLSTDNPDVRFGTLEATPLDGFIASLDNAVRTFAVMGNIPPHSLLGSMSNLSGETIEAAMGQTNRFTHMLRSSWSESVCEVMQLVRAAWGLPEYPESDYQVRWRDMSDQSIGAVVDALGKASTMLGVPGQGLWSRIPGATDSDVRRWRSMASEQALEDAYEVKSAESVAGDEAATLGLFNRGGAGGAGRDGGGASS